MLLYLSGIKNRTLEDISNRFDISKRTAQRYVKSFKDTGFVFAPTTHGYRIDKNQGIGKDISNLLHFSEEEAYLLSRAIQSISGQAWIKSNLCKKLYALYDYHRVADTVLKKEYSENVHQLIHAINKKKQVILKDYRSANNNKINNRRVEPIEFTTNYTDVWCYEPATRCSKVFKIARIGAVEITESPWHYEASHQPLRTDAFRMSGEKPIDVKLKLTLRACNLLIEEFPLAEKGITTISDTEYIYEGTVYGLEGVGRFVLGLMHEAEVVQPIELQGYVEEKVKMRKSTKKSGRGDRF